MKLPCENHSHLRELLKELGAKYQKSEYNKDIYFSHPTKNFRETDEALRLREFENKLELTYKGPKFNQASKSRKEISCTLTDTKIISILENLGFKKSGVVNKQRELWKYDEFDIALDNVEGLGTFVEIEVLGHYKRDLDLRVQQLNNMALMLKIDPASQIQESYLELLEKTKKK